MKLTPAIQRGQGRARQLTAERLVNMYPEKAAEQSLSPLAVLGCPGATLFKDLGDGFIRGMHKMQSDDSLWVVHGLTLYNISSTGIASSKGTIASSGRVAMASTGTELAIAAGGKGYIWNGSSLSEILDKDFPRADTVDQMDGYFIWNNSTAGQKGQFFISGLLDGDDYDALDFATAERYPDNLQRVFVNFSDLLLFGTDSLEFWFNSGNAAFPFEPRQGGQTDKGLGAKWSVESLDNTVIWLDNNGIVRMLDGYTPVRVSTHSIEYAVSQGDWRTTDSQEGAYSYSYIEEGHEFYVLTVPNSGTFVYDAATRLWHERKSLGLDISRMGFHAFAFGKHIVGDVYNGNVYESSLDVYRENGEDIIAEIICPQIREEGNRFIIHKMELDMDSGVGIGVVPVVTEDVNLTGWTIQISAADNEWNGIAWGAGLWVAVSDTGSGNRVMTSPDGEAWITRSSAENNPWEDVAYGNGVFVAVASNGTNRVMTSEDGITWTARSVPAKAWKAIEWVPELSLFVAVASSGTDGLSMTSPDGITWTTRELPLIGWNLFNASYDSSLEFVGTQDGAPRELFFSTDGTKLFMAGDSSDRIYQYALTTAWDLSTSSYDSVSYNPLVLSPESLFFKDDGLRFFCAGSAGTVVQHGITSAWDLSTAFQETSFDASAQVDIAAQVAFKPDGLKMYILSRSMSEEVIYQYSLSSAWDVSTATYDNKSFDVNAITSNPCTGLFIREDGLDLFLGDQSIVYKLTMGTAWDISTLSNTGDTLDVSAQDSFTQGIYVKPDGEKLYTMGANNKAVYQYSVTRTRGANSLSWSPKHRTLVAVTSSSTVFTSFDAISWEEARGAVDNDWQGVAWSDDADLFAAVSRTGTGDRVMTSREGINWTSRTSATDNNWNDVQWSPVYGLFAAVSDSGTGDRIMTSADGITWASDTSPADNGWNALAWSDDLEIFAAVSDTGTGNRVMISEGEEVTSSEDDDSGNDPMVMLDVSSDTRTYDATQKWRSFGKKGEYSKRTIWRRLGQHRSFTPKFSISAPVKRAVFAVYVDVEPCRG